MTLRSFLEDFHSRSAANSVPDQEGESEYIEAARTEGYERGYASGWEDASKAAEEARKKIDAEFTRNIQDLSFTFHEATNHVRGEVLQLLDQMMTSFFPEILPRTLRESVRHSIQTALEETLDVQIQLVASPDGMPFLSDLLEGEEGLPITLTEEATLAPHQVFIRFAEREIDLNFSDVLEAFSKQLTAIQTEGEVNIHVR